MSFNTHVMALRSGLGQCYQEKLVNNLGKGNPGGFYNSCLKGEDKIGKSVTWPANNFFEMNKKVQIYTPPSNKDSE